MLWHGSPGQLNAAQITAVRILLSCLCWNLAHASAGREAGLNSMHNLVVEGAAAAVTAIGGAGTDLMAAATVAATTAVAMSAGVGSAGPGTAAGAAGAGGAAGTGAGPKPAVKSVTSVLHCGQFDPGRKCNA